MFNVLCVCVCVCVCMCVYVFVYLCTCDRATLYPYLTMESADRFSQNLIEQYGNIDHPEPQFYFHKLIIIVMMIIII